MFNKKNPKFPNALAPHLSRLTRLKRKYLWSLIFLVLITSFVFPLFIMEIQHHESEINLHKRHYQSIAKQVQFALESNLDFSGLVADGENKRSQSLFTQQFADSNIRQIFFVPENKTTLETIFIASEEVVNEGFNPKREAQSQQTVKSRFGDNWVERLSQPFEPVQTMVHGGENHETTITVLFPIFSQTESAGIVGVDFYLEGCDAFLLAAISHRHFLLGVGIALIVSALLASIVVGINGLLVGEYEKNQMQAHLAAASTFTAGIIHELKNALSGVVNYSKLISIHIGQPEKLEKVSELLNDDSEKLVRIVDSFLNFCRLDNNQYVKADLAEIIRNVIGLFSGAFRKHQVNVSFDVIGGVFLLPCNPQLIEQVLVNVFDNSCRAFSENGKITGRDNAISITLNNVSESDGEYYHLTIIDNGPGIPLALQKDIGKPFFSSRKANGEGNGLGVSNAIQIVNQHGGDLIIASEEGRYTRVDITFPADERVGENCKIDLERSFQYENVHH